ncbi:MAG: hypothetical protein LBB21_00230 [Holosporaceae bacterium]|jgi:hypothetical protein|nr:hypothetical protein [Holosporaceae bacterium]
MNKTLSMIIGITAVMAIDAEVENQTKKVDKVFDMVSCKPLSPVEQRRSVARKSQLAVFFAEFSTSLYWKMRNMASKMAPFLQWYYS